jgi:acetyl-CoA carboxylase biotin carboxylase subunit
MSKLAVWAPTRDQAVARARRALGEYAIHGVTTNTSYLAAVLDHPAFRAGAYDTGFCARHRDELAPRPGGRLEPVALVAAAVAAFARDHHQAEASAIRAGADQAARSRWLRLGRARALRGSLR